MCFSRNISQWRLNIDKIFLPWTEYTAMLFLCLFIHSQPQTAPARLVHVAFHWQFWQKPGCLPALLLLLSAPLQNLHARVAKALNIKIKHVLKVNEHNQKLSLKFSTIPGPVKLNKLRICCNRQLQGNNWRYWLCASSRKPPTLMTQHTKLRLNPSPSGEWGKIYSRGLWEDLCPHQISIIVIPGFIQLITYFLTCLCASAASRKSFQISSLAWSSAFFSSLVVLQAAVRL